MKPYAKSRREKIFEERTLRVSQLTFKGMQRRSRIKSLGFWIILLLVIIFIFYLNNPFHRNEIVTFVQFNESLKRGVIKAVEIDGSHLIIEHENGKKMETKIPKSESNSIWEKLISHGVVVSLPNKCTYKAYFWVLLVSLILLILFIFLLFKFLVGTGKSLPQFAFGKSRARMYTGEREKKTFKDIVLPQDIFEPVQRLIDFLKDPKKYRRLGGKIETGFLLAGPPGTGKTLLSRAIANEAKVPFFSINGSQFVEAYPGVGAARVRDLFEEGKKHSPCIIFIDQIDIITKKRIPFPHPSTLEYEITFSEFLHQLDDLLPNSGIIVFGETNRPDLIDEALIRPGRLNKILEFKYPTPQELADILRISIARVPLSEDVDPIELAQFMSERIPKCTGAIVVECVNLASILLSEKGGKKNSQASFKSAIEQIANKIDEE